MAGDQSIVMSEQQRAEFCLTLMAVMYGHTRQPADAELLRRLQRRRAAAADQPPPIRGASVVENTEPDALFAYTPHDADDDEAYSNGGFGAVPALSEAIVSLPEMAIRRRGGGEAREKECGVCLEGFEEGDKLRKMPCEHYFHESCVFKWLQVSRLCPYCRFAMPAAEEEEHNNDEEDDEQGSTFSRFVMCNDETRRKLTVRVTETREEEACAVCLEGFKEGDRVKKMPCSHDFHANCISDWLRVSRLCPHCRFALPAEKDSEQKNPEEA
uniref:RING-type domain-containing protein n=1 Tax=Oryza glaberrima TaxID=4538 RepID=I1R3W5_ORYGL